MSPLLSRRPLGGHRKRFDSKALRLFPRAIRLIDRRTWDVSSRLDALLYACHHRLVNGYLSLSGQRGSVIGYMCGEFKFAGRKRLGRVPQVLQR
jgi:hypothetical protein